MPCLVPDECERIVFWSLCCIILLNLKAETFVSKSFYTKSSDRIRHPKFEIFNVIKKVQFEKYP